MKTFDKIIRLSKLQLSQPYWMHYWLQGRSRLGGWYTGMLAAAMMNLRRRSQPIANKGPPKTQISKKDDSQLATASTRKRNMSPSLYWGNNARERLGAVGISWRINGMSKPASFGAGHASKNIHRPRLLMVKKIVKFCGNISDYYIWWAYTH